MANKDKDISALWGLPMQAYIVYSYFLTRKFLIPLELAAVML